MECQAFSKLIVHRRAFFPVGGQLMWQNVAPFPSILPSSIFAFTDHPELSIMVPMEIVKDLTIVRILHSWYHVLWYDRG